MGGTPGARPPLDAAITEKVESIRQQLYGMAIIPEEPRRRTSSDPRLDAISERREEISAQILQHMAQILQQSVDGIQRAQLREITKYAKGITDEQYRLENEINALQQKLQSASPPGDTAEDAAPPPGPPTDELTRLTAELENLRGENGKLKPAAQRADSLEAKVARLAAEVEKLLSENGELQKERGTAAEAYRKLMSSNGELQQTADQLSRKLTQANDEIEKLRETNNKLQKQIEDRTQLHDEELIDAMRGQKQDLEQKHAADIAALKQQLAELEAAPQPRGGRVHGRQALILPEEVPADLKKAVGWIAENGILAAAQRMAEAQRTIVQFRAQNKKPEAAIETPTGDKKTDNLRKTLKQAQNDLSEAKTTIKGQNTELEERRGAFQVLYDKHEKLTGYLKRHLSLDAKTIERAEDGLIW
jgi:chromosome segregation ATPase